MELRPAGPADLDAIAGLYLQNHLTAYRELLPAYVSALTQAYCREKWDGFLRAQENRVWVACEDGALLGFAACLPDSELPRTRYLESLQVSEEARGKGVGTALIRRAARDAEERGDGQMSVCIIRGNERAGNLYRRLGAEHFKYFQDDFHGTPTQSEKLLWKRLPIETWGEERAEPCLNWCS